MQYERKELRMQPHRILVAGILEKDSLLSLLLNERDPKRKLLMSGIRTELDHYSERSNGQTANLTRELLSGISGQTENPWIIRQRRGALKLLEMIPLNQKKVAPSILAKMYLKALKTEDDSISPHDRVDLLVSAGYTLLPHLPRRGNLKSDIIEALNVVCSSLEEIPELDTLKTRVNALGEEVAKQYYNKKQKNNADSDSPNHTEHVIFDPRIVVNLVESGLFSIQEIADVLGTSEDGVRLKLMRARRKLREMLNPISDEENPQDPDAQ